MNATTGGGRYRGVFVTGTDTEVGKTVASAVLAKAWQADYWKPFQTGHATEPGDTETVAGLLPHGAHILHPPASVLQAPLAPWAAAREEGVVLNVAGLRLPATARPLVVEGAGGLYVPIDDHHMMIDLARRLSLPVVLVARSTLGTINHTLLSLHALRAQGLPVLGVVMNGIPSAGNRHAIEHFGRVRVIAELAPMRPLCAQTVSEAAQGIAPLAQLYAMPGTETQPT